MDNHLITKYNQLAEKECKTMDDWVGKVIHR